MHHFFRLAFFLQVHFCGLHWLLNHIKDVTRKIQRSVDIEDVTHCSMGTYMYQHQEINKNNCT